MKESWIEKLQECIDLLPDGTTCQAVVDQLKELWKSNRNKCIFCNPSLMKIYDKRRKAIADNLLKQIDKKYIKVTYGTVIKYICESCYDKLNIQDMINAHENYLKEKSEQEKKRKERRDGINQNDRIYKMYHQKGTPAGDFYTLRSVITKEQIENLKTMKYSEFLGTIYWKVIRRYVAWKRHYRCELCNSDGKLNVHHKTYVNKEEELNYLDDLILLCQNCHSKHHDKMIA